MAFSHYTGSYIAVDRLFSGDSGQGDQPEDAEKEAEQMELDSSPRSNQQENSPRCILHFPDSPSMTYIEKLEWTIRLGQNYPDFEALLIMEFQKPYLTVKDGPAVGYLTTVGFENVRLIDPRMNNVPGSIAGRQLPQSVNPGGLRLDECIIRIISRETLHDNGVLREPQLMAVSRNEGPPTILVTGIGFRNLPLYPGAPEGCFRCLRWGNLPSFIEALYSCRYRDNTRDSSDRVDQIMNNIVVMPQCINCGGQHDPNSAAMCVQQPTVIEPVNDGTPPPQYAEACSVNNPAQVAEDEPEEMQQEEDEEQQQQQQQQGEEQIQGPLGDFWYNYFQSILAQVDEIMLPPRDG